MTDWATGGRYVLMFDEHTFFVWDNEKEERMTALQVTKKLNEQQDQIIYWKHRVNGLLWILSQFDKEKVKELLKELDNDLKGLDNE